MAQSAHDLTLTRPAQEWRKYHVESWMQAQLVCWSTELPVQSHQEPNLPLVNWLPIAVHHRNAAKLALGQSPPTLADQNRQALRRPNARPQTIGLGGDTHNPSDNAPSLSRDSSHDSPHTSCACTAQNHPVEHPSASQPPVNSPSSNLSSIPDSPAAAPPSISAPASLAQTQGHVEHPKRANKREADATTGRSKNREAAVTAESLDARRHQLLKMCSRVANQMFPTVDTRTPMSNKNIPVAPSGHPASSLKLDARPAPVPSHPLNPSGNRHGKVKKHVIPAVNKTQLKPKGVDIRTAPSTCGKLVHVHSAPSGGAKSPEIQHHEVKKSIPPPVYVSTLQDAISPIIPMITSPGSNSPDPNPLLDLLSAAATPHPDCEVIDQRIQDPPSFPSPCYLISPTEVFERCESNVQQPDLIILSPTNNLGLLSESCSPLSFPANDQQDEKRMLGSHDAILGILLLCCPPVQSAPTMSNHIGPSSSATPPSSATPIPQEEFICHLVQAKLIPRADHRSTQPGILRSLPALQEDPPDVGPIELLYQRSLPPTNHGDQSSAQAPSQSQNSSDHSDNVSQNDSDELEYMNTSQASIDELESMSQDANMV
ncbi:hypothetical protein PGTUg99_006275 [Puccinia graminis f. sp. tritici]|uniref:Uncharacterized protein n=2 Tax=Puccinia graminis f. sp. tritici TaxID=56615 RepID=A0A5B0SBH9_PUCGR|nr:hypothetical protein PGTUg99_006275 [Puccinia graminis f. sp. tritici]